MSISRFGAPTLGLIEILKQKSIHPGLWRNEVEKTLSDCDIQQQSLDDMIGVTHRLLRMVQIFDCGLENNAGFYEAMKFHAPADWTAFESPPVGIDLQESLARKLYNVTPGTPDKVIIRLDILSRIIGPMLVEWCLRDRIPFYLEFDDPVFKALLINHADDNGLVRMAENFISRIDDFKKIIFVGAGLPDHTLIAPAPDRAKILGAAMAPYNKRRSSGEMFYTLTQIPTRKDSEIDQIPYDEYLTLFFEMCDQPWDKIGAAQAQLIAEFNAAKTVRITNSDGTDISMDIDGFTFANSLIAKNVPGSELFSAPRIDSTNGIIVAKGRFTRGEQLMENITLHFRDGVLAEYKVETGQDIFEHIISVDDGARRIGELGIGTNPHLKRHVANGLLVEKIGGSFHIALGAAYTYTDYMGTPVRLDNGNTSALHWDITTMLYGKQGRIALDGRVVMNDGFWVDPRYDVLNRGWAAIPEAERPAYWRNKLSA